MDGGWSPPPFTARPVTVTLPPIPASYSGLTQVTPAKGGPIGSGEGHLGTSRNLSGRTPGLPGVKRPPGVHPGRPAEGPNG